MIRMDWNYLAGFFDGEGSIWTKKDKSPQVQVKIVNTDKLIMDELADFLVSHQIDFRRRQGRRKKEYKVWYLISLGKHNEVLMFLKKIVPFLKIKKYVAQRAIAFIEERKWGRYTCWDGIKVKEEIIQGYLSGSSSYELGRKYDIDSSLIRWRLKEKGLLRGREEALELARSRKH